jgi:hypothetical protein
MKFHLGSNWPLFRPAAGLTPETILCLLSSVFCHMFSDTRHLKPQKYCHSPGASSLPSSTTVCGATDNSIRPVDSISAGSKLPGPSQRWSAESRIFFQRPAGSGKLAVIGRSLRPKIRKAASDPARRRTKSIRWSWSAATFMCFLLSRANARFSLRNPMSAR